MRVATSSSGESLAGVRVAVTRSVGGEAHDRLIRLLLECGARPIAVPLTDTEPPTNPQALVLAFQDLAVYDWLIVTSSRAVPPLQDALRGAGLSADQVHDHKVKICAVGPRTGEALTRVGLEPHLVPDRFKAEAVAESLIGRASPGELRILFPRAEEGRDVIPRRLRDAGAQVDVVVAYRTVPIPGAGDHLSELLVGGEVDVLTFTAGSAAKAFTEAWASYRERHAEVGSAQTHAVPDGVGVVALGPATASVLRERGVTVHRVATPHTFEGLVAALKHWAGKPSGER